ncbi:hypothetical protein CARUB_v10011039mg [Capsella rubella]|uniref:Uncharacterized protein n=1 Tax=Capsella rubella TaxID=81985 RepID=R0IE32_9BRAS|nr:hypothetical protein CARUB_v10011039mg [Capsella rubella]
MWQIVEFSKLQSHLIKGLWFLSSMVILSSMAAPEQSSPLMFHSLGARILQAAKMEFKARAVSAYTVTVS